MSETYTRADLDRAVSSAISGCQEIGRDEIAKAIAGTVAAVAKSLREGAPGFRGVDGERACQMLADSLEAAKRESPTTPEPTP